FSHGATRNLAVDAARGETVALLTQDALPVDDWWLGNLVTLLDTYPGAGGVFGRHFARPDASAFIKRDLMLHFDGFADGPIVVTKEDRTRLGSAWHYFSNNNSAIRRSVWKDMPFPDLPFGEDQVWARTILDAGYQKLYANRAAVYHSHEYDPDGIRARAAMEAGYFCRQFGYVLVASEEDLLEQLLVLNDIDMRWGSGRQLPQAEIDARLALNAARLRGLLDGYREARYGLDIEPPSPTELQPPPPSTRATGSPRGETGAPS